MRRTDTIIIGGGQAGLAMSRVLTDLALDHVVLERGRVGERWRSESWDSLRLLTPRWMSRLPGWSYRGPDPDGYMTKHEVVRFLEGYARSFEAPVESGVQVRKLEHEGTSFRIRTDRDTWRAHNVVIATGACDLPLVPDIAAGISPEVLQIAPSSYRNPAALPEGGVLIVGASSSGVQLASEIRRSGRPVTLAVARHTRLPRTYRGRDILAWLDRMGVLRERAADVPDVETARRSPSLQLVGHPDHRTLDLGVLARQGVRLAGRLTHAEEGRVHFAGDLAQTLAVADERLARMLGRIDRYIEQAGIEAPDAEPTRAIPIPDAPLSLDLAREGIRTVVWATGYRRDYPWLAVPVLDPRGEIRHVGGVTPVPGLYALGLRFLRRRNSNFLDGVGADAIDLGRHIERRTVRRRRWARPAAIRPEPAVA